LKHELPETQIEIEKERLKSQNLQQENDRLLSEVNRAQNLCHSQAKELDRLHQNQAQLLNLHNHFKHRDTMNISSLKHSRIEKTQNCQNTNVLSQQGKNKFPQNSPESTHAEKPKYPADQQHCGFLCVPL
jgi:predicted nuclease with TOPRIM domain